MKTSPASSTSSDTSMTGKVAHVLGSFIPRSGPEYILAEDVRAALTRAGIPFKSEATLQTGRVDLRVEATVIELKVKGTATSVLKQLQRYTRDTTVEAIILVTTSRKLAATMPTIIGKKPLTVIYLMRL